MTRFARAKGSKSSNERVPEQATSWSEMKKQMLEKNKDTQDLQKKKQANQQREENYKKFLEEVEIEKTKNVDWAEFPANGPKVKKSERVKRKIINSEEEKQIQTPPEKKLKKVKKEENGQGVITSKLMKIEEIPTDDKIVKKKRKNKKRKETVNNENNSEKLVKREEQGQGVISPKLKKVNEETRTNPTDEKVVKKKRKTKNQKVQGNQVNEISNSDSPAPEQKPEIKKNLNKAPLTEDDAVKIEKKKQKKIKQLEKRKMYKKENPDGFENRKKFLKKGPKPERRKKMEEKVTINGKEMEIQFYDGFPIKKEDAVRIQALRKEMISRGLPRSEIRATLKLERRKAEKAFAREKKKVCFKCRKSGHNLSECPNLDNELAQSSGTGICYKCGSTEHTHFECKVVRGPEFKHAECFICHEQGHISRQCPDNPRGLYPKGGACKVCGEVTHLKKDCPKFQAQQERLNEDTKLEMIGSGDNPDSLGGNEDNFTIRPTKRPNKIVKF